MILAAERYIRQHPETGYKEFKTSAYMGMLHCTGARIRAPDEDTLAVKI